MSDEIDLEVGTARRTCI